MKYFKAEPLRAGTAAVLLSYKSSNGKKRMQTAAIRCASKPSCTRLFQNSSLLPQIVTRKTVLSKVKWFVCSFWYVHKKVLFQKYRCTNGVRPGIAWGGKKPKLTRIKNLDRKETLQSRRDAFFTSWERTPLNSTCVEVWNIAAGIDTNRFTAASFSIVL